MNKRRFFTTTLAGAAVLAFSATAQAQWKPNKPINLIVPWAAGGSTDQVTRVTAAELEKVLGQKIVVVNQPGAAGSIGSKNAWEAPRDGYTWTAGAAQDLGTYQSLGMLNAGIKDWHLFLNVANIAVVGVNPSTPWQNVGQLIEAMKARPDIKVATAGVTSGGHNAMEAISRATGAKYRHVTYDGGNPAVVATVSGETEVTTQLAVEQIEPISKTIAGFKAPPNYFGIFIPKGVPAEVIATLEKAWAEHIVNNEALKKYAANRGALFAPAAGEAAQTAAFPAVQANAWLLHAGGKTKVAPDTVGIAKP